MMVHFIDDGEWSERIMIAGRGLGVRFSSTAADKLLADADRLAKAFNEHMRPRILKHMRTEISGKTDRRGKNPGDITTMRVRRSTLARLEARKRELGATSLDEALETILFRQRSYEAITRLKADPQALADYQREASEWAEVDTEVHE